MLRFWVLAQAVTQHLLHISVQPVFVRPAIIHHLSHLSSGWTMLKYWVPVPVVTQHPRHISTQPACVRPVIIPAGGRLSSGLTTMKSWKTVPPVIADQAGISTPRTSVRPATLQHAGHLLLLWIMTRYLVPVPAVIMASTQQVLAIITSAQPMSARHAIARIDGHPSSRWITTR